MPKLCFMLRSAVLFGLLTLVWAAAAVAQQPARHIIGVTDVPAALHAIPVVGLRVLEVIPTTSTVLEDEVSGVSTGERTVSGRRPAASPRRSASA